MNNKIKELFRRYETGQASEKERELVEAWFSIHDRSPVEFNEKDKQALNELDNRMDGLLNAPAAAVDKRPIRKLVTFSHAAVWAGLVLMSALAMLQLKKTVWQDKVAIIEKINIKGQPVRYVLPDSSQIYLGAGSKLRYPESFSGGSRTIDLEGVAFFNVKPDAAKPFIIHTGEIETQVLGTSFKVDAFSGQPVVVAVATGKVGVSGTDNGRKKNLAVLTPGQQVTWDSKNRRTTSGKVDIYALEQWQIGNLVYDETPLEQIIPELERRFAIKISFDDASVAAYKVSSTFSPKESPEEILQILGAVGKFKFRSVGDRAYIIYTSTE